MQASNLKKELAAFDGACRASPCTRYRQALVLSDAYIDYRVTQLLKVYLQGADTASDPYRCQPPKIRNSLPGENIQQSR